MTRNLINPDSNRKIRNKFITEVGHLRSYREGDQVLALHNTITGEYKFDHLVKNNSCIYLSIFLDTDIRECRDMIRNVETKKL